MSKKDLEREEDMMTLDKFYQECSDENQKRWVNSYREEWMSEDQWLLYLFLNRVFCGFHHIPSHPKVESCGNNNLVINSRTHYLANYDYDYLTKMVIMAHNWGVRVSIQGSGPGMIKISLWKRHKRDGDICDRMPTIDEMVRKYRDY